jgi:hypothetical protein
MRSLRILQSLVVFVLGVWAGVMGAAAFVKRAVPSRGEEESEELALVAVFDGVKLESRAKIFRGGSMFAWFGGIDVDLGEAELAPGATLSVHALLGGVVIRTPPNWRVESNVKVLAGGVNAPTPAADDRDAPVLTLEGMAVIGGIAVETKPDDRVTIE